MFYLMLELKPFKHVKYAENLFITFLRSVIFLLLFKNVFMFRRIGIEGGFEVFEVKKYSFE